MNSLWRTIRDGAGFMLVRDSRMSLKYGDLCVLDFSFAFYPLVFPHEIIIFFI